MVDNKPNNIVNAVDFNVSVVKHQVTREGHAEYIIKVIGPRDISFHLKDRYSSIREFQSMVKKAEWRPVRGVRLEVSPRYYHFT